VWSNFLLQQVRDAWVERAGRPRLTGRCFWTRVADEFIIGCELEADAQRVLAVRPQRFARLGLRLHPEKTALIAFRQPPGHPKTSKGNGPCDLLGRTHDWAKARRG
jgi:hypothetical protein